LLTFQACTPPSTAPPNPKKHKATTVGIETGKEAKAAEEKKGAWHCMLTLVLNK